MHSLRSMRLYPQGRLLYRSLWSGSRAMSSLVDWHASIPHRNGRSNSWGHRQNILSNTYLRSIHGCAPTRKEQGVDNDGLTQSSRAMLDAVAAVGAPAQDGERLLFASGIRKQNTIMALVLGGASLATFVVVNHAMTTFYGLPDVLGFFPTALGLGTGAMTLIFAKRMAFYNAYYMFLSPDGLYVRYVSHSMLGPLGIGRTETTIPIPLLHLTKEVETQKGTVDIGFLPGNPAAIKQERIEQLETARPWLFAEIGDGAVVPDGAALRRALTGNILGALPGHGPTQADAERASEKGGAVPLQSMRMARYWRLQRSEYVPRSPVLAELADKKSGLAPRSPEQLQRGDCYFWHEVTRETRWTVPRFFVPRDEQEKDLLDAVMSNDGSGLGALPQE